MWRARLLMAAVIAVAMLSWAGLWHLVNNTSPESFYPLLFLVLLFFATAATAFPGVAYLNRRFSDPEGYQAGYRRILRQSGWLGTYAALCAWLQMVRVLNWLVAVILFGVFALVEAFLLTRL
jgi:hypothetical protein